MKNAQSGFALIAIAVIAALVLGIGGTYVAMNKKANVATENNTKSSDNSDVQATTSPDNKNNSNNVASTSIQATSSVAINADHNITVGDTTVTISAKGRVVQTISLGEMSIAAMTIIGNKNHVITDQDINFDGHNDLAVLTQIGYGGANMFYDYYIYNPGTGTFVKDKVLLDVANPGLDKNKKTITSSMKDAQDFYTTVYTFNGTAYVKGKSTTEIVGSPNSSRFNGSKYAFIYPSDWEAREINPLIGSTIVFPKSQANQVISKTLSASAQVSVSFVENRYVSLVNSQSVTLNGQVWHSHNIGKADGATETMLEYFRPSGADKYVLITSGTSNKAVIEAIASSFMQG